MSVRSLPASLTAQQVLGNFLSYFDASGVIISCLQGQEVFHFAQWSSKWGKILALGQCQHLDPAGYDALWTAPPEGLVPELCSPEGPDLRGLTDEQVLKAFMQRVECDAAILSYNEVYNDGPIFWRWRNTTGRQWTKRVCEGLSDRAQPLWCEAEHANQHISPANYAEMIRLTGQESRRITAARALQYGWDAQHQEVINASARYGRQTRSRAVG